MKTIKILLAALIVLVSIQSSKAQSIKENIRDSITTQTIKVYGECAMCKKRIETAASGVDGVQSAIWDVNTKLLSIKYSQFKTDAVENVQRKIAAAGHDTELYTASDAAYNSLPGCCHYSRKPLKQ